MDQYRYLRCFRCANLGVSALLPSIQSLVRVWSSMSAFWYYSSSSLNFSLAYHYRQLRVPCSGSFRDLLLRDLLLLRVTLTMGGSRQYQLADYGFATVLGCWGKSNLSGLILDFKSSYQSQLLMVSTELYILLQTSSIFLSQYSRSSFYLCQQLSTNSSKAVRCLGYYSTRTRLALGSERSKTEGVNTLFLRYLGVGSRKGEISYCGSVFDLCNLLLQGYSKGLTRGGVENIVGGSLPFRQASQSLSYFSCHSCSLSLRSCFSRICRCRSVRYCSCLILRSWGVMREGSCGEQQGLFWPMNSTDIIILFQLGRQGQCILRTPPFDGFARQ